MIGEVFANYFLCKTCREIKRSWMGAVGRMIWMVGVMYWTAPLYVNEATRVSRAFGLKRLFFNRLPEK